MQNDLDSPFITFVKGERTSRASSIKGLFWGLTADLLGFCAILNVPIIYLSVYVTRNWGQGKGINGEEFAAILLSREFAVWRITFAILASFIASFIGAYVFSRIARMPRRRYMVSFCCISIILSLFIHGSRDYTLHYQYTGDDSHALLMQFAVAILATIGSLLGIAFALRKWRLK